jgi:hypothetical protein
MATNKDNALHRERQAEVNPLARKLAESFESYVRFYQDTYSTSRKQAEKKARAGIRERQGLLKRPAEQVTWMCLSQVSEADPNAGIELWQDIRAEARDEIESGHRAAKVISEGFDFGPLDRARFLEVRSALRAEWDPLPGSESMLVDMLAQIQTVWEAWLSKHMLQITLGSSTRELERSKIRDGVTWLPERLSDADAIEMSAAMVDRFNRLYIRTLRALRDLRRMAPPVVVKNVGQVNVGQQQVNVARTD